jgi:hypothetical protein
MRSPWIVQVRAAKMDMSKRSFLKYATGAAAAYPEIDAVATELLALQAECARLAGLAAIFEFPQLVEPVAKVRGVCVWGGACGCVGGGRGAVCATVGAGQEMSEQRSCYPGWG